MLAQTYKIVFNGKITYGYEIDDVKAKLADLFKLNNSQTDILFNGQRVVIKKDLDEQTALKYQHVLKQAGALCKIENAREQAAGNQNSDLSTPEQVTPDPASFRCDKCGFEKKIPAKYSGRVIRCPKCRDDVWVGAETVAVPIKKTIGDQIVESIKKPVDNTLDNQITINGSNTRLAGKEKRFANFLVDLLLACYVVPFLIGFMLGFLGLGFLLDILPEMLFGLTLILSYYVIFEHYFGKTPGKFITGTKVVSLDGNRPTFANIVGRNLCRFIPFEAFSFLGHKGWHDEFSKTVVVESK